MAPFIGVRAISRSQAVRIGKQTVKTGKTTYVDVGSQTETGGIKAGSPLPFSPFKELQNHLAIGAVIVVGPLTFSNADWAVKYGLQTTASAFTSKKTKVVVTAGSVKQRSTGTEVASEGKTSTEYLATVEGKERIDIITASETTAGASKYKAGTAAVTGKAVLPETVEQEKLVTYAKELAKAEVTQKQYEEKVTALEKELLVAEIVFTFPTGKEELVAVRNINRA